MSSGNQRNRSDWIISDWAFLLAMLGVLLMFGASIIGSWETQEQANLSYLQTGIAPSH
jgi:hypothetical protein